MTDIFDFDPKPDNYAVMGNPISHSRSPQIHTEFAKQTKENIAYEAIHVDVGGFKQAVGNFKAHNGKGLNVTVPFKLDAFQLADTLTPRAERAGAVNTLKVQKDGALLGDNTDGFGLVKDLIENLGWDIKGKRILILGAGGASRGVLQPILEQQPSKVFIANRTASKAKDLAEDFSDLGDISGGGYTDIDSNIFDCIINATAASLEGSLPPIPESALDQNTYCYDMMYATKPTIFMDWAKQQGAKNVADGLGMLVGQAAESFFVWRGKKVQVKPVIDLIRKSMLFK